MKKFDSLLYFITDSTGMSEDDFLHTVRRALDGGVTMIQLREKEKTTREYIHLAQKLHAITSEYKVPLIIDDRLDVALASDAEGVHLGQTDMPVDTARSIIGEHMIIGATAKTVCQAVEAYNKGADYLGVGAIYPTTTKVKTVITPVSVLSEICKSVPIPVNAIGGLNTENSDVLSDVDIDGICVVSAIMKSDNPYLAAHSLKQKAIELTNRR